MDNLEYEPDRIYQQTLSSQPGNLQPGSQPGASHMGFFNRLLSSIGEILVRTGNRLVERAHSDQLVEEISPPNFMIML